VVAGRVARGGARGASQLCPRRTGAHAGRVLAAAARRLRPAGPAAGRRVRPRGDAAAAFCRAGRGGRDRGDGQPGGAGLADGWGGSGDPAGRGFVGGAAGGEPGSGRPGADRGAVGQAGRGVLRALRCIGPLDAAADTFGGFWWASIPSMAEWLRPRLVHKLGCPWRVELATHCDPYVAEA